MKLFLLFIIFNLSSIYGKLPNDVRWVIESSEYDVLEKLISDNNLKYISRIFIEFHSGWMKDSEKKAEFVKREKHLINEMPKHTKVHLWI